METDKKTEDSKYNEYKRYDKLIRDKIPKHIKSLCKPCKYHIANDDEYWTKLKEKLNEEVQEFQNDSTTKEISDLLEVIDAICKFKQFDKKEIAKLKKERAKERGKFNKRIILEES